MNSFQRKDTSMLLSKPVRAGLVIAAMMSPGLIVAAERQAYRVIQSCTKFTECVDSLAKLEASDHALVQKILALASPGSTQAQVTQRLGRAPFALIPKTSFQMTKDDPVAIMERASWSTAEPAARTNGPHFEVTFMDGRAVTVRWFGQSIATHVQATTDW